jgi:hypothetical protein
METRSAATMPEMTAATMVSTAAVNAEPMMMRARTKNSPRKRWWHENGSC